MPTFIDGYEIDAVITEDKTSDMDITDFPVEKGSDITDHARLKPMMLNMQCLVSDTPFGALAERRGISLDGVEGAAALSSGPLGDYVTSDVARYFIENLQASRKAFTVSKEWIRPDGTRGYKAYDNMMIQSIGENITADTGDSYSFKVTLKQITFVTNNRTTVKVAVPRAKKKDDKGNKPNEEKKDFPPKHNASTAKFALEYIKGKWFGGEGTDNLQTGGILGAIIH